MSRILNIFPFFIEELLRDSTDCVVSRGACDLALLWDLRLRGGDGLLCARALGRSPDVLASRRCMRSQRYLMDGDPGVCCSAVREGKVGVLV